MKFENVKSVDKKNLFVGSTTDKNQECTLRKYYTNDPTVGSLAKTIYEEGDLQNGKIITISLTNRAGPTR
jgi:hypothetical protein